MYDNQRVAGATVEVYAVDPKTGARPGEPAHRKTTGADGAWGPFRASPTAAYEFHGHDVFTLDGAVPGGINEGVPGASVGRLRLPDATPRSVTARFNEETIVTRTWPRGDGHVCIAEFHD